MISPNKYLITLFFCSPQPWVGKPSFPTLVVSSFLDVVHMFSSWSPPRASSFHRSLKHEGEPNWMSKQTANHATSYFNNCFNSILLSLTLVSTSSFATLSVHGIFNIIPQALTPRVLSFSLFSRSKFLKQRYINFKWRFVKTASSFSKKHAFTF